MWITANSAWALCRPTLIGPHKRRRSVAPRRYVASRAKQRELQRSVDPTPPSPVAPERGAIHPGFVASGVACIVAVWVYLKKKKEEERRRKEEEEEDDSAAYLLSRARTRQALKVQKAIGFSFANLPARVMVEIEGALKENAECRSPVIEGTFPPEELEGLYRTFLQNTDVPPDFAALLQLRSMLSISAETAERIEKEVQESNFFSI